MLGLRTKTLAGLIALLAIAVLGMSSGWLNLRPGSGRDDEHTERVDLGVQWDDGGGRTTLRQARIPWRVGDHGELGERAKTHTHSPWLQTWYARHGDVVALQAIVVGSGPSRFINCHIIYRGEIVAQNMPTDTTACVLHWVVP